MTNAAETSQRGPSLVPVKVAFYIVALGAFVAFFLLCVLPIPMLFDDPMYRLSREKFERDLAALKSGQSKSVHLYDAPNADALLVQLAGMPEVEELSLCQIDATDAGFAAVEALPNLRTLRVDTTKLTDGALAQFRQAPRLETISLRHTRVTSEGLRGLQHFSKLRSLSIQIEDLNDSLEALTQLKTLHIGGDTSSQADILAIDELRAKLPACKITKDPPNRDRPLPGARD